MLCCICLKNKTLVLRANFFCRLHTLSVLLTAGFYEERSSRKAPFQQHPILNVQSDRAWCSLPSNLGVMHAHPLHLQALWETEHKMASEVEQVHLPFPAVCLLPIPDFTVASKSISWFSHSDIRVILLMSLSTTEGACPEINYWEC